MVLSATCSALGKLDFWTSNWQLSHCTAAAVHILTSILLEALYACS